MTVDVARHATSGVAGTHPEINNGGIVVGVQKTGTSHTRAPINNSKTNYSELESKLTDRYDDPTYYSA